MKNLLFLLLAMIIFSAPVFSQKGKKTRAKARIVTPASVPAPVIEDDAEPPFAPPLATAKPAAPAAAPAKRAAGRQKPVSNVLKEETIGIWGVASLLIPEDLSNKEDERAERSNKNVTWKDFSREWKQPADYNPSALEVRLWVTIWNNPVSEVVPDLRPDLATPENLVLLDLLAGEKQASQPKPFLKESRALEISGFKGAYYLRDSTLEEDRFTLGWGTYRYHEGKLQSVLLSISGANGEQEKALRILHSLKLE